MQMLSALLLTLPSLIGNPEFTRTASCELKCHKLSIQQRLIVKASLRMAGSH